MARPWRQELADAVETHLEKINFLPHNIHKFPGAVARYLADLYRGTDRNAEALVNALDRQLEPGKLEEYDARALGRAIRKRGWSRAASTATSLARRRKDFVPIVKECLDLLGFFERLSLPYIMDLGVQASEDDLWRVFEDTAAELYPTGPDHNELWSRAGGADAYLPIARDTGRARWHRTLKEVRAGKASVRPGRLVAEMQREFHTIRTHLAWRAQSLQVIHVAERNMTGRFEKGRALIVAISNYQRVSDLPTAVLNDATDIAATLTDPDLCGYAPANVRVLIDSEATKDRIVEELQLLAAAGPEDTVIVYFSGHGGRINSGAGEVTYLCPVDCDVSDLAKHGA